MKTLRPWAHAWWALVIFGLLMFTQVSVASSTGAPFDLPSSESSDPFHLWKNMHASSYQGTIDSALLQCYNSVFVASYLDSSKCQRLGDMLKKELCMEVLVEDGLRLDHLNGRVNGNPKGESKTWSNQEKATGRLDRALWCDLGDGVHAYWFTGVLGQSCNNVGFVFRSPPPPTVARPQGEWVCRLVGGGQVISAEQTLHLDSLMLDSCCCGNDMFIPSLNIHFENTVQSPSQTEVVCGWE